MDRTARLSTLVLALSIAACDDDTLNATDASVTLDAGTTNPADATAGDATGSDTGTCTDQTTTEELDVSSGTETTHIFTGLATGAEGDGTFSVTGPNGEMISGPLPTDANNKAYAIQIPLFCGDQMVALTWTDARGCPIQRLVTVHRTGCTTSDIQVTLTWDVLGLDWELHLILEGGQINDDATDCTWTSCISSSPDWGVVGDPSDDPHKDVDNTGSYGPENIYLSNAAAGTYTVMVEHWATGGPESDGAVTINVLGEVTQIPIENLPPQFVRTVATIEWPSGTVTTSTVVHDCTANWSSGCRDPIP